MRKRATNQGRESKGFKRFAAACLTSPAPTPAGQQPAASSAPTVNCSQTGALSPSRAARAALIQECARLLPEFHAEYFEQFSPGQLAAILHRAQAVAALDSPDPEQEAREDVDATAPLDDEPEPITYEPLADTIPEPYRFPVPTVPRTPSPDEPAAIRSAFGTKPARRLRPAQNDDLFNPAPQMRLNFTGGN